MLELYQSDFRVRIYIAKCLEEIFHKSTTLTATSIESTFFQVALCYELGFGV